LFSTGRRLDCTVEKYSVVVEDMVAIIQGVLAFKVCVDWVGEMVVYIEREGEDLFVCHE
jgi:hypothetical protein